MGSNGEYQTKRAAKWLRIFLPVFIILIWLAGAGVGGPYFGKVSEVSSNDPTNYLPESSESARVQAVLTDFYNDDVLPAVVVFSSDTPISAVDLSNLQSSLSDLQDSVTAIDSASPIILADDSLAAQAFLFLDSESDISDVVSEISQTLNQASADSGIKIFITGAAGFTADLVTAFSGIDGLLLITALIAVFIILIFVYRSLLLPIAVLSTSVFALATALLCVWWLAKAGIVLLSGQIQGILFILVIGAATDYSLLYVSRFREELSDTTEKWAATVKALRGAVAPIIASGGTVIIGLLTLLLSDLKSNSALGPVATIGILFAMLAALTLLPSILYLMGRAAFWPKKLMRNSSGTTEPQIKSTGLWGRISTEIKQHPRVIWIGTTLILLAGTLGVFQLQASGVPKSDLVITSSEARDGQKILGEHFPAGSGSPIYVLTDSDNFQRTVNTLLKFPEVSSVSVSTTDTASGTANVTEDGIVFYGPSGATPPRPTVIDGKVLLQATITLPPDSVAAEKLVTEMRSVFKEVETATMIGGVTATALDTNDASIHDRNLIIPVVLIVILLLLMLLLRAIVAPIILVATTVLSFGTAMGVSALVFNHIFKFSGADPAVPLYGFVFLVALGIDYNIFLMTRVREETIKFGTRKGILIGLGSTAGVITSAGIVLAATFVALSVIPILFLVQIAFIVAFGVLLDTFLVRALLVPALSYDIGNKIWWPSRLAKSGTGD